MPGFKMKQKGTGNVLCQTYEIDLFDFRTIFAQLRWLIRMLLKRKWMQKMQQKTVFCKAN